MTIPFTNIPSNLRIPLFFAEIDPRFANTAQATQRTLLIGQITNAGAYTPNVPIRVASPADAITGAGAGSILAAMADAYQRNDPSAEIWALPLADDGSGVAAAGTVAFTGTATASGTLPLYVAGQLVPVAVTVGDTAATVATNVTAAIAANTGLPVSASVSTATVTLTAKNKGLCGNDIDVRLAYKGSAGGEVVPAGISAVITALSGGATNPSLTAGLAALGDLDFDFIVSALNDNTSITAKVGLLADANGRWSPMSQLYGHAFVGYRGTAGSAASFAAGFNAQHLTVIPYNNAPTPPWIWAAAMVGKAAASLRADPALPLQYLTVQGILPPPVQSRYPAPVRNSTLLYSGCSTWTVDSFGQVVIENMVTTYVTNGQGNADNSYLEVETLFTLAYVLRFMSARVQTKFSRVKLASDGVRLLQNSNVVTPSVIRAEIIAAYAELEAAGFVQNAAAFAAGLVVEKDTVNPNRVNVLWPGTLINQLRVFAMLAQFRLS